MRFKFFNDLLTRTQSTTGVWMYPDLGDTPDVNPITVPLGTGHRYEADYDAWLAEGNVTEAADPLPALPE